MNPGKKLNRMIIILRLTIKLWSFLLHSIWKLKADSEKTHWKYILLKNVLLAIACLHSAEVRNTNNLISNYLLIMCLYQTGQSTTLSIIEKIWCRNVSTIFIDDIIYVYYVSPRYRLDLLLIYCLWFTYDYAYFAYV